MVVVRFVDPQRVARFETLAALAVAVPLAALALATVCRPARRRDAPPCDRHHYCCCCGLSGRRSGPTPPAPAPPPRLPASLRWLRATALALGAWYFGSAFLLTGPLLFLRRGAQLTWGAFLETDLLALKHIMHASFILGGVRALATTGNRRYLELVAAVTLLSSFPSAVAMVLALRNAAMHGTYLNALMCTGMCAVCAGCAAAAQQSLRRTDRAGAAGGAAGGAAAGAAAPALEWRGWRAVASLPARLRAVRRAFRAAVPDGRAWDRRSAWALAALWGEVAFHALSNAGALGLRLFPPSPPLRAQLVDSVAGLVEATSLALHWGFLLGNGFHGLRSCTPQCLDMFVWGKALLLSTMAVDLAAAAGGGGVGGLASWRVAELAVHAVAALAVRRARQACGPRELPFVETDFSCHRGSLRREEEHGLSLWTAASRGGGGYRWWWWGRAATVGAVAVFAVLAAECALLPWLAAAPLSPASLGHAPGDADYAAQRQEVFRTFGVAVNFGIHASAMFMLATYRPVRDRFAWEHSRSFNMGTCALFVGLFASQAVGAVLVAGAGAGAGATASGGGNTQRGMMNCAPGVVHAVVLFALLRVAVFAACGSIFFLAPSTMPRLLSPLPAVEEDAEEDAEEEEEEEEEAEEVPLPLPSPLVACAAGHHLCRAESWVVRTLVHFSFVPWAGRRRKWASRLPPPAKDEEDTVDNTVDIPDGGGGHVAGPFRESNVAQLPAALRDRIVAADGRTRVAWWLYACVALWLCARSGFWLGPAGPPPLSETNLGCLSMASAVAFHYCFILTGYGLKGLRSPHVPMLKLTVFTTACVAAVAAAGSLAYLRVALSAGLTWGSVLGMLQLGVVAVVLKGQAAACWVAARAMQRNPGRFPRSGVQHNWM